jgi:D-alanyl-D-alanine dipeptidase
MAQMEKGEALTEAFTRIPFASRAAASLLAALLFAVPLHSSAQGVVPDTTLRRADLVEIASLDTTIRYDIRYATTRNFMGRAMYSQVRALLQRPAAGALLRAHRAYRPWRVTKQFWDATDPAQRTFVANPAKGSKHNRGCAVDCSLYELATGREVVMPTPYDDFTKAAAPDAESGTSTQRARRDFLRRTMEREGFTVEPNEWWHFDYRTWKDYPVLDVPFERLPLR